MNPLIKVAVQAQSLLDSFTQYLSFLAPLALRLYLAPVFFIAGMNKVDGFDNIAQWFGNPDWGLGLPAPYFMALMATGTEVIGAVCLLIGLGVRWVSIPLMVTMLVAIFTVHLQHGWQAVADKMSPFPPEDIDGSLERLSMARQILQEHGNYSWLTENGNFVISNNGIEWATTYFIMLLALLMLGAGKYVSLDYVIRKKYQSA